MIAVEHLSAARKPEFLSRLSLNWGPGVHGVIALPSDGVRLLSSVLAGLVRPASGKVTVLGASPSSPHVRRCIAAIPVDVSLPSRLNVEEIFRVANVLRGDSALREPVERLTTFGIERLLRRSVRSLSRAEVRAVAIAEALTAPSVKVLIVDDPLRAHGFPRSSAQYRKRCFILKGRDGCAVVVTTASLRDATAFADDFTFLRAGKVVDEMTSTSAASTFGVHGEMMAVMRNEPDARALATALVSEPDVQGFDVKLSSIVVRGNDPIALGRALGHAAIEANVDIVELQRDPGAPRVMTFPGALTRPAMAAMSRSPRAWVACLAWTAIAVASAVVAHRASSLDPRSGFDSRQRERSTCPAARGVCHRRRRVGGRAHGRRSEPFGQSRRRTFAGRRRDARGGGDRLRSRRSGDGGARRGAGPRQRRPTRRAGHDDERNRRCARRIGLLCMVWTRRRLWKAWRGAVALLAPRLGGRLEWGHARTFESARSRSQSASGGAPPLTLSERASAGSLLAIAFACLVFVTLRARMGRLN